MKTTPFNLDFQTDEFILTLDIFDAGYYPLSREPEIETVQLLVEGVNDLIYPQYLVTEVTEDLQTLFPEVTIGTHVVTWMMVGDSSSSSSSSVSDCTDPDPINDLLGTGYFILQENIGKTVQVRYISKS